METRTLASADVDLVYDVRPASSSSDGRPPLVMIGQPMTADGFAALAQHFPDRTVVTYDPRGVGRSIRKDGRNENDPSVQAGDLHRLIDALGGGPVELFASSGGAVTSLALVTEHPADVGVLVAHEPPLVAVLPDREAAERAVAGFRTAYDESGFGAGLAAFIAMTSWHGEFTDDYFALPTPSPGAFGLPVEDDGGRDDPLLSARSASVVAYSPDVAALLGSPTRIVIAAGEESAGTFASRSAHALAGLLEREITLFPSHHGGFSDANSGYPGKPEEFAQRLREVLAAS